MKSLVRILIISFFFALNSQAIAQEISEASVKAFLLTFDKAVAQQDTKAIRAMISENADISGKTSVGGQVQSFRMNKVQYMMALQDVWSQASNYTYRKSNQKITISDGKAIVSADIAESMVLQGQHLVTRSSEVATIEKINGTLLVTRVIASTSM